MGGRYLLLAVALAACVDNVIGQAQVPGYNDFPLSATPADIVNDPTGRAHLLARVGNPPQYFGSYGYPWPEGEFAIDPKIDPAVVTPLEGNSSPQNGSFRVIGNSGMIGVHLMRYTNGDILFFGRPAEPFGGGDPGGPGLTYLRTPDGTWTEIAVIYDTNTNTFEPFRIVDAPFCGAHVLLPDGRGLIVGGEHVNLWYPYLQYGGVSVRVYDPDKKSIATVNHFQRARWYPSAMTLPNGNILVVGGAQQEVGAWGSTITPTSKSGAYEKQTFEAACLQNGGPGDAYWNNPSYEIYDPVANTLSPALALTILFEGYPISLYPYLWVLPTGSTLVLAGVKLGAMFFTPDGATRDEAVGILPDLKIPVGPFQYTAAALLDLVPPSYTTRVLVAGGSSDYCPNWQSLANNESYLFDVSPGANHTMITEDLAYGRVMGDLILLPDGRVLLVNGAQIGVGGGGGPRFSSAGRPTTVAEIYDPSKPIGQRWSTVADSQIPRLYHSTAQLTPNADVMIAGSETTSERRVQIYTPDYLLTGRPRPEITNEPNRLSYGEDFNITFGNVSSIDIVRLLRLDTVTHGLHFDSRSIVLDCDNSTGGSISCAAPPNSSIAPPGIYYLFILSEGVPSVAKFVSLPVEGAKPPGAAAPRAGVAGAPTGVTGSESGPLASAPAQAPNIPGPVLGTDGTRNHDQKPPSFINPNGQTGLGIGPAADLLPVEDIVNAGTTSSGGSGGAAGGGTGATG